jgi:hypothetical protein
MLKLEQTRHQVATAGHVSDAQTGQAILGADVSVKNAAQDVVARARTAADGHYHFLDLPDGQYTLEASLPDAGSRYGMAQAQATVTRGGGGKIRLTVADMALPPTTIKGQITGPGATPIILAEVRVKGSGERALTDAGGRYALIGLEVGVRTALVSARGYQPASATVQLSVAGAEHVVNVALVPSS